MIDFSVSPTYILNSHIVTSRNQNKPRCPSTASSPPPHSSSPDSPAPDLSSSFPSARRTRSCLSFRTASYSARSVDVHLGLQIESVPSLGKTPPSLLPCCSGCQWTTTSPAPSLVPSVEEPSELRVPRDIHAGLELRNPCLSFSWN